MTRNYLLLTVLATGLALTTSVSAQEADAGAELEEIVVTGSYLFTGLDSPSPVVVITGDEIVTAAPTDLATYFFDNVPQNNARDPVVFTTADGQLRIRSLRTAAIDLRGLGSENTLVLLNGRRTIENPTLNLSGWRQTDINAMVPRIAIGRADLLLDGGSATFGSDAVAGVVNTVTRNDFEGFDFSVDGRFFEEEPSAKNITLSALWGAGNENSHVIAAIEYHETDRLPLNVALDTATNNPDVDPQTGTGLSPEGSLSFSEAGGRGATSWLDPDCGNPAFGAPVLSHYPAYEDGVDQELYIAGANPFGITGTSAAGGDTGAAAESCAQASGFNPFQTLQNDTQVVLAFVAGEHNFSDRLTAKVELNFSRQRFNDQEFWGDLRNGEQWIPSGPSGQGTEFAIPLAHPGRIWAQDVTVNTNANPNFGMITCPPPGMGPPCVPGPGTVYAFGETLPFLYETDAFQESDLMRAAFTLEGDITADWHWKTDATAAYNTVRNGIRDTVTDRYPDAINGLGGANCTQGGSPDPTDPALDQFRGTDLCQYLNPFMSSALPNAAALGLANDADLIEWLTPIRTDVWDAEFYSFDALVTGFVGELPGGPIGVAFGAGVRSDFVSSNADQLVNAGETATTGVFNDWGGRQKVESVYAELALPIRDNVDIQLAARYEDYENGYSEVTPKIAALWTPTDALTLRASWGQSFKGPSVVHLTADTIRQDNASQGVTVNGIRYGQGGAISGLGAGAYELRANQDLVGQTSDNYSLGFDFNVTDNISVGATYVIIEFKDRIASPNLPTVLGSARCFLDINGIPAKPDGLGGLTPLFAPPPGAIWVDTRTCS